MDITAELKKFVGEKNVLVDEPMARHTTFEIGGPVQWMVLPQEFDQVRDVVAFCRDNDIPLRVIGLGSDLLVSDDGLDGVVMKIAENLSAIVAADGGCLDVMAGASNQQVAGFACEQGLAGYEFASGIPGSVGGAAIMNAGAYGGEFKDVAVSVTCLRPDGEIVQVSAEEADWSYRHSMMSDEGYVVLAARLKLHEDASEVIAQRMDDLRQKRESKQPLELPSAGSTFKRPEGYYVGPLLQEAGLQGYTVGGAQVSTKHAGFVVNIGGATAADVRGLIAHIQEVIREKNGVELVPEVRMWGF